MIEQDEVKAHIENKPHFFMASVDKHVYVKGAFVMGIECKNYTENAMLKRIMLDFMMLRSQYPNLKCALFQLESQLGGDHSELNEITLGSKSSHTIMSLFDFPLQIVTFLKGERKVDQPIHKPGFYKQMKTFLNMIKTGEHDWPGQNLLDSLETMKLSKSINYGETIFTHNPWGEYGHEEHIQVFRVIMALSKELTYPPPPKLMLIIWAPPAAVS